MHFLSTTVSSFLKEHVGLLAATLALVLLFPLGVTSVRAQSTLTLCNNGTDEFSIVAVWQSAFLYPFDEEWTASGWFRVEPGCEEVVRTAGRTEVFLSVARLVDDKSNIVRFEIKSDAVRNSQDTFSSGAERFFCVSDNAFTRQTVVLDDHELCPSGYYLQLFNLFAAVAGDTNFTTDLD